MDPPEPEAERYVGVVLAGGDSSRMGRDKAVLELDGEPLASRAARKLSETCSEVVCADGGRNLLSEYESVADVAGRGPVAGVLGATLARPGQPLVILACDLPSVPPTVLRALTTLDGDWVVPRWQDHLEPLCALYRGAALARLAARVTRSRFDLHGLAEEQGLDIRFLEEQQLNDHGSPEEMFLNLNRPEDLERL